MVEKITKKPKGKFTGGITKYKECYNDRAYKLAKIGATNALIAKKLKVNISTLFNWTKTHPGLKDSIICGRTEFESEVERALMKRAVGFTFNETKTIYNKDDDVITKHVTSKYYPPETSAAVFWLKNKFPDRWKERVESTVGLNDVTRSFLEQVINLSLPTKINSVVIESPQKQKTLDAPTAQNDNSLDAQHNDIT